MNDRDLYIYIYDEFLKKDGSRCVKLPDVFFYGCDIYNENAYIRLGYILRYVADINGYGAMALNRAYTPEFTQKYRIDKILNSLAYRGLIERYNDPRPYIRWGFPDFFYCWDPLILGTDKFIRTGEIDIELLQYSRYYQEFLFGAAIENFLPDLTIPELYNFFSSSAGEEWLRKKNLYQFASIYNGNILEYMHYSLPFGADDRLLKEARAKRGKRMSSPTNRAAQ